MLGWLVPVHPSPKLINFIDFIELIWITVIYIIIIIFGSRISDNAGD
jgi:hypothetical protein